METKSYTLAVLDDTTNKDIVDSLKALWRARLTWLPDQGIDYRVNRGLTDPNYRIVFMLAGATNVVAAGVVERLAFDKGAYALSMAATSAPFSGIGLGKRLLETRIEMAEGGALYVTTKRAAVFMGYGFREIDKLERPESPKPLWTMYRPRQA